MKVHRSALANREPKGKQGAKMDGRLGVESKGKQKHWAPNWMGTSELQEGKRLQREEDAVHLE